MQVGTVQQTPINFRNAGIAAALEENVFLNKALLDATADVQFVWFSNNKVERKERLRRVLWNYTLVFLSPFVTLPLTNKLAMKYIAKLTPKLTSKENNLIHISNKFLRDKESLKEGIKLLSKEKNTDYSKIIEKCGGDYEILRKKLINAKNSVLSFDFFFSTGSVVGMAFLNNALTKKKTNMDGYSAEFELVDREKVEKRASKYKKSEPLRKGITAGLVGLLTLLPLAIKRGLISDKTTGFSGFIKRHADKFDYTSGKFMKRLPLFMFLTGAMTGVALASRNRTEVKNNLVINSMGLTIYFGGDLLLNSLLAKFSDKFLKTQIVDNTAPRTFINKIVSPTVPIKKLSGKSQKIAKINFLVNFITLAIVYGYGMPHIINKIVRKDLKNDKTV